MAPIQTIPELSPMVADVSSKYSVYDGKMFKAFIIDASYPST